MPDSRGVLSIGGLDSSLVSTSSVLQIDATGVNSGGALATPLHDAAAASLGKRTLVFGGGAAATIDSVESLDASGSAQVIGRLPTTRSDLSAVGIGGRAYILGGYDGSTTVPTVLETTDGKRFRQIARMPTPVRYAAVAAVGNVIYAFGGELSSGADTDAIQAIDVQTGSAKVIGHVPHAFSHGSAVAIGTRVFVLGGRVGGQATAQLLSFDPGSTRLKSAASLPYPVTNAAAAVSDGVAYLVGGLGASGAALDSVITMRLVPPAEATGAAPAPMNSLRKDERGP